MKSYRIATIPGDGIGQEVVPQGIRVLNAAGRKFGINFDWDHLPWSCEFHQKTGAMMPRDGLDRIRPIMMRSFSERSDFPRCRTTYHCGAYSFRFAVNSASMPICDRCD